MSNHGVGMPHALKLHAWARQISDVFGTTNVYQVGSSIKSREYHDVDVRVLLDDAEYERWFPGLHTWRQEHDCAAWVGVTLAFSLWGQQATGLPIDFQVQRVNEANDEKVFNGLRSHLGGGWLSRTGDKGTRYPVNRDADDVWHATLDAAEAADQRNGEHSESEAGLVHPNCDYLAAHYPHLAVAFCNKCGWRQRMTMPEFAEAVVDQPEGGRT